MSDPLDFSSYEQMLNQRPAYLNNVRLRFFYAPKENKAKSQEAGRPIYDQIEKISIINPGSRDEFIAPLDDELRGQYQQAYDHWKKTQQQPSDGTPLEMVPFLNVAQVQELKALNIASLEHLAGLSDSLKQRIGMGALEMVRKAQAYLAAAKGHAVDSRLVAENEDLKRRLSALEQSLIAANQRYEKVLAGSDHPPPVTVAPPPPPPPPPPAVDVHAIAQMVAQILQANTVAAAAEPDPDPEPELEATATTPQFRRRRR